MNDTKEHIILLASKLFLQKSFKEVTMKELVDATGLSKGAFYHYFESKEQLFKEVLYYFFTLIKPDYDSYSKDSLYQFYNDYIDDMIKLSNEYLMKFGGEKEKVKFTMNYFMLIFDALKIYPEYRELLVEQHHREIAMCTEHVKRARERGEIKSHLTDEEIANTYMYLSDGYAMHMMIRNRTLEEMMKEFKLLWNKIYQGLKA